MNRFDTLKKNFIFQQKIFYKKDAKEYLGCLVKSKYADESDKFELILFENKITRKLFISFDLIEYEKIEIYFEEKKNDKFYFQLIPKHQQSKEIFVCDTEENRNKWMKILNETIQKLDVNNTYEIHSDGDDEYIQPEISVIKKANPTVLPRTFNSNEINKKFNPLMNQLNSVLFKQQNQMNENEIFYHGIFDDLHKILLNINKPGVFAVSQKTNPDSDSTWALRVYESSSTPISSWNIYFKINKYYLIENDQIFSNIIELCSYYTEHDLPTRTKTINRLFKPYTYYSN